MSTLTIELNDDLRSFADTAAAHLGCADASVYVRSLLENARETAELHRKIQEAQEEIERGEFTEWKPGDGVRMFQEILKRRNLEKKS